MPRARHGSANEKRRVDAMRRIRVVLRACALTLKLRRRSFWTSLGNRRFGLVRERTYRPFARDVFIGGEPGRVTLSNSLIVEQISELSLLGHAESSPSRNVISSSRSA